MAKKKVNRPSYGYDQQAARERNAKVPIENVGIMQFDPRTGTLNYPNLEYSNTNPEMRYFNPYLGGAPVTTPTSITPDDKLIFDPTYGAVAPSNPWDAAEATGPGAQTAQPTWDPRYPVFEWARDDNGNFIPELGGVREGVPPEAALGVDPNWSSSYHPLYYQSQYRNPLTAIWGGSNRGTMGTRGWRRPGSSYMPEQTIKRAGDNVWAERPEFDRRTRWQKFVDEVNATKGNNNNLGLSVGSPVTWRT